MALPALTEPFEIGGIDVPNRVALAPLAGIGNWFVRLQAKRFGAGLVFSEMISSFAIHHRNEKTMRELLVIDEREREYEGPVALQLFGQDPDVMRSAAETAAGAGADIIDLNMGCPVPKVCRNGAGSALISDPQTAVAIARAAGEGSGLHLKIALHTAVLSKSGTNILIHEKEHTDPPARKTVRGCPHQQPPTSAELAVDSDNQVH